MPLTTIQQVEDALFDWAVLATGLAEDNIVWANQPSVDDGAGVQPSAAGAPQPLRPFITLQIIRTDVEGLRGGEVRHTTPTAPAPAAAPSEFVRERQGTLVINAYAQDAQNIIEDIRRYRDAVTSPPVIAPTPAAATIMTVAGASLVDGETFVLEDGTGLLKTFEFDDDASVLDGNVAVDISGAPSADVMRDRIVTAIGTVSGWPTLLMSAADGGPAQVDLTHLRPGRKGNKAKGSDTVADAGFVISLFSGGEDSDISFGRELGSQDQTAEQGSLFNKRARIDLEFGYRLREDDPDAGAIEQVQFIGCLDDTSKVIDVDLTQA